MVAGLCLVHWVFVPSVCQWACDDMGDLTGSVDGGGADARGYEEVLLRVQTVALLCWRVHLTGLSVED